ncbi:uncharacterized protein LOC130747949 [Lotus japonicus]|uniref:uncharacterized protein LOC130747949 n=1 Tax=Lotus japonicus TaxID=34305 RepID=UPI002584F858|nr:uncharacterized protein LOC130747949 [Lotus japonicus]
MKLEVDGSYRQEEGVIWGGGLLRDHTCKWITDFMFQEKGGSSFCVEAKALRDGLRLAWDRGFRRLICASDNQELVRILSAPGNIQDQVHDGVVREIHEVLNGDWQVDLSWCRREGIAAADWLARNGSMLPVPEFRIVKFLPPELEVLLLRDSLWIR